VGATIAADKPGDESFVDIARGASCPMQIPIEARDEPHLIEHRLWRVALGASTFDVSADMRNERPMIEPSDRFKWDE